MKKIIKSSNNTRMSVLLNLCVWNMSKKHCALHFNMMCFMFYVSVFDTLAFCFHSLWMGSLALLLAHGNVSNHSAQFSCRFVWLLIWLKIWVEYSINDCYHVDLATLTGHNSYPDRRVEKRLKIKWNIN